VIPKQTNSAFIGTDLQERLRRQDNATLVIAGVITNNSVEATVRMADNLGFETYLVEDACFTLAVAIFEGANAVPMRFTRCRSPIWRENTAP
jgi:nicotinamidase-related amidase